MAAATPSASSSTAAHDQDAPTPLPARVSVVDRFLEVRGIERKKAPYRETTKPVAPAVTTGPRGPKPASVATLARLPQRTMWDAYTKSRHGDRTLFAREAMRVPDESYSDSADVYNPRERPKAFIKIHEDAADVDRQFLYRARCLIFERDVVDREVCDLEENQAWYDEALDRVYDVDASEHDANLDVNTSPSSYENPSGGGAHVPSSC